MMLLIGGVVFLGIARSVDRVLRWREPASMLHVARSTPLHVESDPRGAVLTLAPGASAAWVRTPGDTTEIVVTGTVDYSVRRNATHAFRFSTRQAHVTGVGVKVTLDASQRGATRVRVHHGWIEVVARASGVRERLGPFQSITVKEPDRE
jgi:hypothetical protein